MGDFESDETKLRPARVAVADAPAEIGPGYTLRGRYRLEEMIGQGAMGQVWRAKDLLSEEARDRNPYLAIKVLNSDFASHPDSFVGLHQEASRAQKLAHPNIVTVHGFDRDDVTGRAFIAMELLEGRPLDRMIRDLRSGGLARSEALPIIRGMAEGLAYAHRKGVVHSDFKPGNVFVTREGTPKILDFGIARAVQGADHAGTVDESIFQGYTPTYAAPETIEGKAASTSEDVFALGLVAYELLTGSHPFRRKPADEACKAGLTPAPIRGLKRSEWKAICTALAFERAQRYADASVFLRQLQGVALLPKVLATAVIVLVLIAGVLWYRNELQSRPAVPFEALPTLVQDGVREALRQGNEALQYLERTQDISASADAAQSFAEAYRLHPKNPDAVAGLERAADLAIAWYEKMPDRAQALEELKKFEQRSEFYADYSPLKSAIRAREPN